MTDNIIKQIDDRIENVSETIVLPQQNQTSSKESPQNEQNPYIIFGKYTQKLETLEKEISSLKESSDKEISSLKESSDKYIKKDWKAVGVVLGTISITSFLVWSVINVWVLGRVKNSECKQETIYLYNSKITNSKEFQKSYSDCSTK